MLLGIVFHKALAHDGMAASSVDSKLREHIYPRKFWLTKEEEARGTYHFGEGITGKVVESGMTMVVPRIGDEPGFLSRRLNRDEDNKLSFLCVPIKRGQKFWEP